MLGFLEFLCASFGAFFSVLPGVLLRGSGGGGWVLLNGMPLNPVRS